MCDPWHYLPILEKKPGALRHGAPFQQWGLPTPIRIVRDRILKQDKGDRAFVELLLMARTLGDAGLETLACDLTLQTGIITQTTPTLQIEPKADCSRYDSLRRIRYDY